MAAGSIVIDMLMNTGSFEAGTEKVSYQLQRSINQFQKLTGTMVEVGKITDQAGNSVKALALGYDSLTNSAKLVEASNKAMTAEIMRANAAMKAGAISAQNAAMLSAARAAEVNAEAQRRLAAESARTAAQQAHLAKQAEFYASRQSGALAVTNRMSGALQQSHAGFRAGNQIVQQASYQITDFVMQVNGGVSAIRAFGQQAPQLLGAFGAGGAAAGLVVALGAAFAPMVIEAVKGIGAVKNFDDAQKALQDTLSSVNATAQTFDLKNIIEQFNKADAKVRESIVSLIEYRKELLSKELQQTGDALKKQLKDIASPSWLQRAAGQFENNPLGLDKSVAAEFYAEIRSGTTEATILLQKYGKELAKGNDDAIKLSKLLDKMNQDTNSAANAASQYSKLLQDAAKAGSTGIIPTGTEKTGRAPKTVKEEKSDMDLYIESIQKADAAFMMLGEKRQYLDSLKESLAPEVYQKFSDELDRAAGGLQKINENALRIGPTMEQAFGQAIQQGVAGLVDVFFEANQSFSQFAANFLTQIAKMITQMMLLKAIEGGLNAWGFGSSSAASSGPVGPVINPNAKGNAFYNGIQKFANGGAFTNSIVSRPTMFAYGGAFGGKAGVMGEAGPEAIMPLKRDASGRLGVQGSQSNVSIVVNNNSSNAQATATSSTDSFGNRQIEILVADMVNKAIATGKTDGAMRNAYNIRRAGK